MKNWYREQITQIAVDWCKDPIVQAALIVGLGLLAIARAIILVSGGTPADISRKMWQDYREETGV